MYIEGNLNQRGLRYLEMDHWLGSEASYIRKERDLLI
jgi:hypothetical protein